MNTNTSLPIVLTEQQRAIVNHNHGPALVFAVAGAGKTTALEYRIARLVHEQVFSANRILAAAYNRTAAEELKNRLQKHPGCDAVKVLTLHALALQAVRQAKKAGYFPTLAADAFDHFQEAEKTILKATLAEAYAQQVPYKDELNSFDEKDFLTWVSARKGNLCYPDIKKVAPALAGTTLATQALEPVHNPWYLELYQLFEKIRQKMGLLTFDDQLVCGWEALVNHNNILQQMQSEYDCVLVDEFQDVNLAQSEILAMLVCRHHNYMVIGDDDQTIYEWRGANPQFILEFKKRYNAREYIISENFRCKVGPIVLANHVIKQNTHRRAKALQLTKGLDGTIAIIETPDTTEMGNMIATKICKYKEAGTKLSQMAVLVRVYAQTPVIEQALIREGIPYEVTDKKPFYQRSEVQTLINYCRLGYIESLLLAKKPLTVSLKDQLRQLWNQIYWQPKRYISKELSQQIVEQVSRHHQPFSQVLAAIELDNLSLQKRLQQLSETLIWLSRTLPPGDLSRQSGYNILTGLDERLGYTKYLEERSSISETGADEAETVRQFISYARDHGDLQHFLQHIQKLEEIAADAKEDAGDEILTMRSIHTAKGKEWPIIFIPSCNDRIMPHALSTNVEEERRLLYVAITRSSQDLFIYYTNKTDISPFLTKADYKVLLSDISRLSLLLNKPIETWTSDDVVKLATLTPRFSLESYFQGWWPCSKVQQQKIAEIILSFFSAAQQARLLGNFHLNMKHAQVWQTICQWEKPILKSSNLNWADYFKSSFKISTPNTKPIPQKQSVSNEAWQIGEKIKHPKFGEGRILSIPKSGYHAELEIQFGNHIGIKKLTTKYANLIKIS